MTRTTRNNRRRRTDERRHAFLTLPLTPLFLLGLSLSVAAALSLGTKSSPAMAPLRPLSSAHWDFAPVRPLEQRATTLPHSMVSCDSMNSPPTEFELKVGKALDVLRADYPHLLTENPNFEIYDDDIEVVDPSGVKVHGLGTYKNSWRLLHALISFVYCPARSSMTFRMCFDKARQNIRIHWNARVVPREIFGRRRPLHVDGISVYEFDRETGEIVQHRIEKLLMNSEELRPEEGVIAAIRNQHTVTVPSFSKSNQLVEFQSFHSFVNPRLPSLFAVEESAAFAANSDYPDLDWEKLEAKNKSRKKFGLKPLTPEEFLELEAQVEQMDSQQRQQAASMAAAELSKKKAGDKGSFFDKLFGDVLKDTCESNYDCERPEVCCDFGFKKMCCRSGTPVVNGPRPQLALVPVPVDVNMPDDYPPRRF